jgi:DinB superfamily
MIMTTTAAAALTFPGMPILEQTPGILRTLLAAAAREDLDWQPSPERWSISMVLAHLAEVELKAFRSRFAAMADGENPFLAAYDQLELFRSRKQFDALVELESFEQRRGETLAWLKSLPRRCLIAPGGTRNLVRSLSPSCSMNSPSMTWGTFGR